MRVLNKFRMKSMPFLAISLTGILALTSISCLKSDGKDEPPQNEKQTADSSGLLKTAAVRVKTPQTGNFDLREVAERVRIGVVPSVGGQKAEATEDALIFPISADETYTLSDVRGGDVFILVEFLNEQEVAIAKGELRTQLNAETVPEVQVGFAPLPLEVGLTLAVSDTPAPEVPTTPVGPAPAGEPAEVKAALKSGSCLGCHSTRGKQGGLVLDTFPYVSTNPELIAGGDAAVMKRVVERVTSTDNPMPPSGLVLKPEAVAVLDSFRRVLETPAPAATQPASPAALAVQTVKMTVYLEDGKTFETELVLDQGARYVSKDAIEVTPGKSYNYDLSVYGRDGMALNEVKKASFTVPLTGLVELSLSLN